MGLVFVAAVLRYHTDTENSQEQIAKRRQTSKLDDHALIPLADFVGKMREVLTLTPKEIEKREAGYQRQQSEKRKTQTSK